MNAPTLWMVLATALAEVSSSGVRASEGSSAASAGVNAVPAIPAPAAST